MKPLKFKALLKQTIWGGDKIIPFKHLSEKLDNVGESWEISGVKDNETMVSEGDLAGQSLNDIVRRYKGELVGKDNYERFGDEFPLLIKFIDARQDLSIQVHPTDEIAHRQGKRRGKTEMWYIMNSEPDAKLYCGLKEQITPEQYKEKVEDDTITDALAQYSVKEATCSSFLPVVSMPSVPAVSWPKYSKPLMLPTVSTTSSAKIRTVITANCIRKRLPNVSTSRSRITIEQSMFRRKTKA